MELSSFKFWIEIRRKHFHDDFTWTRCLFRRSDIRSMRDKTVHNYSLHYSPISGLMDNTKFYISTGEYLKDSKGQEVPILLEMIPYITEVFNGVNNMFEIIREESYEKLREIQNKNIEAIKY
jgi:hypothetical protein